MPTRARRWDEQVRAYESERSSEPVTRRHLRECVRIPRNVGKILERGGLSCSPEGFGERQLRALIEGPWSELQQNTQAYHLCLLGQFLKRHGNLTVDRARLRFDRTPVRRKTFLDAAQRAAALSAARQQGIVPYSMVVLMLCMGLRPSEVRRLTVEGAAGDPIVFHGKGRGIEQGRGKIRRVPRHRLFDALLPELMAHRAQLMARVRVEDPGFLFCHVWKGKVRPWGKAWMERHFVRPVFERAGIPVDGNLSYAFRRTWGRVARLEQGNELEKVSRLLGHSDTRTTLRYLALDDADDRRVMDSTSDSFGRPLAAARAPGRTGGEIGHAH